MPVSQHAPERLRRFIAMGCFALVLLLDVLAVSPEAHAWFHAADSFDPACAGHDHPHSDAPGTDDSEHTCVVFAFAAGHALLERVSDLVEPARLVVTDRRRVFESIAPRPSRFLRPPACGPPGVANVGT
jgi:hypothetical protein